MIINWGREGKRGERSDRRADKGGVYLVQPDIVDGEVEPDPEAGVAGVWTDEEVVLILVDEVHPPEVTCAEKVPTVIQTVSDVTLQAV